MIEDFNYFADNSCLTADICIIGAGAAGITVAREFIGSRHTVLVLESGGADPEPESQKLYESQVVGMPHKSIHEGRARILGGTTTLWGGQALRFDEFDFERRGWVPNSGWPISRKELDPFYERAERVLHLDAHLSYQQVCASYGIQPPNFDSDQLYMECSQWSPKPNFGKTYRHELKNAANISILLHANATAMVTNSTGTAVENVKFTTLGGKKGTAQATFYIICCGGIETARLLLASNRIEPGGVGNRHDLVGRYFQEHIHFDYGKLLPRNRAQLQNLFESFFVRGLKHAPLITLTRQMQEKYKLLGIHGTVIFDLDQDSGIAAMKKLFRAMIGRKLPDNSELKRLIGKSLANPGELLSLAYRLHVQKRAGTPRRGPILFGAQCEMAPNPDCRIMLSDVKDSLGMFRTKLDWRLGDLERRTISQYIRTLASEFERLGLGTFDLAQVEVLEDPLAWTERAHDSAHHMGTTRMHRAPEFGVVDPHCQVHGMANLYIGSSAVFPTSARSNPTLTLLALCLRLADRLKQMS